MKIARLVIPGLIMWIVPFILGVFFYDSEGNLAIDIFLFKSIMILTLVILASLLSIYHLKKSDDNSTSKSIMTGLVWLFIPILLDVLVLIPIAEMSTVDYIQQIGLRYLIIPVILISQSTVFTLRMKQT